MLAILGRTGFCEDLEVDEAEWHQAEGEAGHESREEHQQDDDQYVDEEVGLAAVVLHRHRLKIQTWPPMEQNQMAKTSGRKRWNGDQKRASEQSATSRGQRKGSDEMRCDAKFEASGVKVGEVWGRRNRVVGWVANWQWKGRLHQQANKRSFGRARGRRRATSGASLPDVARKS